MNIKPNFFDLLIVDEMYPSPFSPFRAIEYDHYMWFFDAALLSLEGWHLWFENRSIAELAERLPEHSRSRIFRFDDHRDIGARLAYVTFLNNAYRMLPYFKTSNIPFILQLYPGGGFALDVEEVDRQLKEIIDSGLCVKIITTQINTKEYLLKQLGCSEEKIEFIYGGVFDSNVDFSFHKDKLIFGRDKETLDLCFVAHKYGDDLRSKGYDYFVQAANWLAPKFAHLRFHVVGGYRREDIDLGAAGERFSFYGPRPQAFFGDFYPRMDAILSFNRPFVLTPGAFDGFPTGSCLEAGFRGVANIVSDPLKLNIAFEDGRDLVLLDDDFDASMSRIEDLCRDPAKLARLGQNACTAFRKAIDVDRQLWARTKIIADELYKHRSLVVVNVDHSTQLDRSIGPLLVQSLSQHITYLEAEVGRWRGKTERRRARLPRRMLKAAKHYLRTATGGRAG